MLFHLATTKLEDLGDQSVKEVTVVGDDDRRAVECFDGFFQHIFRWHVEVVGRLIEDKQVDGLEQQPDHRQPGALTAAEHLDFLLRDLATEHEGTEEVVDLQAHVACCHLVDGVVDGEVLIEHLRLVLCEIAYLYVVPDLQFSGERDLSHDTFDEGRLTFTVLSDKRHLLAAFDRHVDVGEDDMVAIRLAYLVADDRIVAGAQTGRKLQVHDFVVHLIHFDRYYFLQLSYLLLHLYGLGSLIAEALDERLCVGYLFLLVLPGSYLLLAPFLAQLEVFVVFHLIVFHMSAGNL